MTKIDEYEALQLENQLCFPLYACARNVIKIFTHIYTQLGKTNTQSSVSMNIWNQDSISVGELGKKLYLDNGTLTPLLKKMQEKGYLTRQRSRNDERIVLVSLTEKGWALRDQVKDIPSELGACVPLTEEESRTLYTLLYKIIGSLEK